MNEDQNKVTESESSRSTARGCSGWVLLVGFTLISLSGWVRMARALNDQFYYTQVGVPSTYLIVSGACWGLVGLAAVIWMIFRLRWTGPVAFIAALFFAVTYWLDRLVLSQSVGVFENAPFAALVSLLALLYVWLVVWPGPDFRLVFQDLRASFQQLVRKSPRG